MRPRTRAAHFFSKVVHSLQAPVDPGRGVCTHGTRRLSGTSASKQMLVRAEGGTEKLPKARRQSSTQV